MNDSPPPADGSGRAAVIGGGLAGMLAAAALARRGVRVDVLEPYALPTAPGPRQGLPQARHAHLLMSGGAEAMDALVPGTLERLRAAGARLIPLPTGMVGYSPEGWYRRWDRATQYVVSCTRDLLDHTVRAAVLADPLVTLRAGGRATGLLGGRERVTGVLRARPAGGTEPLAADLVVDASGRGTRLPVWLAELGVGGLARSEIDSGLVYASRMFRSPVGDAPWPVVMVQADSRSEGPGLAGTVLPVEGGRWLVSLSGTRGGRPTGDADAFVPFARGLRHPLIADLLARAEPLTGVSVSGSTGNERRYYEKVRAWPEGIVALGDAVAAYNPVYGHGMSVAAQGALALARALERADVGAQGLARRAQRAIARPVGTAWALATGQDIHYPDTTGGRPRLADRVVQRYASRLSYTATGHFATARALTEVMTLQGRPARLFAPTTLTAALRGPRRPPLEGPQFTSDEQDLLAGTGAGD